MNRFVAILMILLTVIILPGGVLAANGSLAYYTTDAEAPVFSDVSPEDWFHDAVETAAKAGLMIGKGENRFAPDADITLAEVCTIAARVHAIYTTGSAKTADEYDKQPDKPWSYGYVKYCMDNGIMPGEPGDVSQPAFRIECASLLSRALPEKELRAINTVEDNAIPDLPLSPDRPNAADVYKLYRAGVLTGVDEAGTFMPESKVRRCEVAAMLYQEGTVTPFHYHGTALSALSTDAESVYYAQRLDKELNGVPCCMLMRYDFSSGKVTELMELPFYVNNMVMIIQ